MALTEQHCCYIIMALLVISIILLSVILYKGQEESYAVIQKQRSQTTQAQDPCTKFKRDNTVLDRRTGQRSGFSCTKNAKGIPCHNSPTPQGMYGYTCFSKKFSPMGPTNTAAALTK